MSNTSAVRMQPKIGPIGVMLLIQDMSFSLTGNPSSPFFSSTAAGDDQAMIVPEIKPPIAAETY